MSAAAVWGWGLGSCLPQFRDYWKALQAKGLEQPRRRFDATTQRGYRQVLRSRVTCARRVESAHWVYDRKIARGERLAGQRAHWQWSRAESGSSHLHKENGRLCNTIELRGNRRTREGKRRNQSRNFRTSLRERMCGLSRKSKRPRLTLIGNTTGHVG
jgi:hypothetical protein